LIHFIVDYDSNRLFWVDAKLHVIFASDFNGQNRQVILTSYDNLMHPFSVAVFEVRTSFFIRQTCLSVADLTELSRVSPFLADCDCIFAPYNIYFSVICSRLKLAYVDCLVSEEIVMKCMILIGILLTHNICNYISHNSKPHMGSGA